MKSATVIVGDAICGSVCASKLPSHDERVYLRGHNTYEGDMPNSAAALQEGAGEVIAAINGMIEITDRVVSVKGMSSRYHPEVGDIVVGRIREVSGNRWRVDVGSHQEAVMLLSNVTEPGGILRRRGRSDELTMRHIFDQDDLVVAEVQRVSPDGVVFLHTRSGEKYGRLSGLGVFVSVSPALVKRAKHQFFTVNSMPVSVVLGMNGRIWVSEAAFVEQETATQNLPQLGYEMTSTEIKRCVSRVANCIKILSSSRLPIFWQTINSAVKASLEAGLSSFEVVLSSNQEIISTAVVEAMSSRKMVGL